MSPSIGRAAVSLFLAPAIALSAIVAPEHRHEADAEHPRATVHRHVEPHALGPHDHDRARLGDEDGPVVWLDGVMALRPTYGFDAPLAPPAERRELVFHVADWVAAPDYSAAPPHGPPRASLAVRAPPSFPA